MIAKDKLDGLIRLFQSTIDSADRLLETETNPKERSRIQSLRRQAEAELAQLNKQKESDHARRN